MWEHFLCSCRYLASESQRIHTTTTHYMKRHTTYNTQNMYTPTLIILLLLTLMYVQQVTYDPRSCRSDLYLQSSKYVDCLSNGVAVYSIPSLVQIVQLGPTLSNHKSGSGAAGWNRSDSPQRAARLSTLLETRDDWYRRDATTLNLMHQGQHSTGYRGLPVAHHFKEVKFRGTKPLPSRIPHCFDMKAHYPMYWLDCWHFSNRYHCECTVKCESSVKLNAPSELNAGHSPTAIDSDTAITPRQRIETGHLTGKMFSLYCSNSGNDNTWHDDVSKYLCARYCCISWFFQCHRGTSEQRCATGPDHPLCPQAETRDMLDTALPHRTNSQSHWWAPSHSCAKVKYRKYDTGDHNLQQISSDSKWLIYQSTNSKSLVHRGHYQARQEDADPDVYFSVLEALRNVRGDNFLRTSIKRLIYEIYRLRRLLKRTSRTGDSNGINPRTTMAECDQFNSRTDIGVALVGVTPQFDQCSGVYMPGSDNLSLMLPSTQMDNLPKPVYCVVNFYIFQKGWFSACNHTAGRRVLTAVHSDPLDHYVRNRREGYLRWTPGTPVKQPVGNEEKFSALSGERRGDTCGPRSEIGVLVRVKYNCTYLLGVTACGGVMAVFTADIAYAHSTIEITCRDINHTHLERLYTNPMSKHQSKYYENGYPGKWQLWPNGYETNLTNGHPKYCSIYNRTYGSKREIHAHPMLALCTYAMIGYYKRNCFIYLQTHNALTTWSEHDHLTPGYSGSLPSCAGNRMCNQRPLIKHQIRDIIVAGIVILIRTPSRAVGSDLEGLDLSGLSHWPLFYIGYQFAIYIHVYGELTGCLQAPYIKQCTIVIVQGQCLYGYTSLWSECLLKCYFTLPYQSLFMRLLHSSTSSGYASTKGGLKDSVISGITVKPKKGHHWSERINFYDKIYVQNPISTGVSQYYILRWSRMSVDFYVGYVVVMLTRLGKYFTKTSCRVKTASN